MKEATHLTDAGAAATQEVIAAKAPSCDEAPIVTYYRTKTIDGVFIDLAGFY